ncbi:4-hydroxybenzoyl-CoA thioesterase [Rhodoferax koreense]|uniref:4-hydroxybenzoyl-CoA thioesterase n=1 Tax=Rhodoferax koreensis TaxID=1842727 RepID=A0A1P8JWN3_9BURK|nr:YbgC/FadM family acyl-CoA thioesterase [Rhodoferax koreense]APW38172.1 4-hydroxybenzoyl-CoA thioesterase [Rhodoferax koreense]
MTEPSQVFSHRLRVRWSEVDMQRIVFNAHYLAYLDVAITEYWRALGLPYFEAMEALGGEFYLKKATLEYHASARADDLLDITLRHIRTGNSSMLMAGAVKRGDAVLVSGELLYVFADPSTQKPTPVPEALRALQASYAAGEPVFELKTGAWSEFGPAAGSVRHEVFVEEQGIPKELEWDDADQTAVHAVVFNRLGQPLATGRLLPQPGAPGVGRIGRMAVKKALRGTRVGRAVLEALVKASAERGDHEVLLHAQTSAEAFYLRCGFTPRGEVYEEAGIPHREMFRTLV